MGRKITIVVTSVLSLVLAILIAPNAPFVQAALQELNYVDPTCEDTQRLVKLDIAGLVNENNAEIVTSSYVDEDKPPDKQQKGWLPMRTFDGRPETGWVPATKSAIGMEDYVSQETLDDVAVEKPTLIVRFEKPQRIRMLCVINGSGANAAGYARADRIRTAGVQVSGPDIEAHDLVFSLRSMPEHEVQNRQTLLLRLPKFESLRSVFASYEVQEIRFTILDRYSGTFIEEPGCSENCSKEKPTRLVMLGELEMYVEPPKEPKR